MERPRTALVADGDPHIQTLIAAVAGRHGFRVLRASGVAEALDAAVRERPAIITVGDELADGTGFDLIARLKLEPATVAIPVVAIVQPDHARLAPVSGCVAVLAKPFDAKELAVLLQERAR